MRTAFLLLFTTVLACPAQIVSFGVKAGVPATDAPFQIVTFRDKVRWTVGPTMEVRITRDFSFELDALYRGSKIEGQTFAGSLSSPSVFWTQGDTRAWDFPFLLKYRILHGPVRPFVNAGLSLTHETADSTSYCSGPLCPSSGDQLFSSWVSRGNSNRRGEVVGVGLEMRAGRIKIAPELRYTRLSHPNGNLAELLVGFTF